MKIPKFFINTDILILHTLKLFCGVSPLLGVPVGLNPPNFDGVPLALGAGGGGTREGDSLGELLGSTFLI